MGLILSFAGGPLLQRIAFYKRSGFVFTNSMTFVVDGVQMDVEMALPIEGL